MSERVSHPVRRFVTFQAISILGDRIAQVSVPLALLSLTGSPTAAAIAAAANQLPSFLLAITLGQVVDRGSRKRLTILSDWCRGALYFFLAGLFVVGPGEVYPIYITMFVIGIFDTLAGVSNFAWLPSLASGRELLRANEFVEGVDAGVTIVGPPIGGLLLAAAGRSIGLVVNGLTFVVSAIGLSPLPADRPVADQGSDKPRWTAGIAEILRDRTQRMIQVMASCTNWITGSMVIVVLALGDQVLELPEATSTLAISAAGVGGVVASFVIAPRVRRLRLRVLLGSLYVAVLLGMLVVARSGNIVVLAAGVALVDAAITLSFIVVGSLRQLITDEEKIGRVAGASGTFGALIVTLSALAAGLCMRYLGIRETAALWSALMIPAVLAGLSIKTAKPSIDELAEARG